MGIYFCGPDGLGQCLDAGELHAVHQGREMVHRQNLDREDDRTGEEIDIALSSGLGYTFQIIGQKDLNPAVASLIMSLESVISALAGWLLLHQTLQAIIHDFVTLLQGREPSPCCTTLDDSMTGHRLVFRAEESRKRNGAVITV